MDVLLNADILREYFSNVFNPSKTDHAQLISSIINNESNSIIINRELIEEYENILKDNFGDKIDNIFPFLENLITNKSIQVKSSKLSLEENKYQNAEVEYRKMDIGSVCLIYANFALRRENSINNKYSCIIQEISGLNNYGVIATMAGNRKNSLTVRYYDFTSNRQIEEIFNLLYSLSDRYNMASIYDRQINFNHNLFDGIKDTHKIHYYTRRSNQNRIDNADIKRKFKSVKIFRSGTQNIHERRVIIKELIIEADNDFWNLRHDEPTWKIDVIVCTITAGKLSEKNKLFQRDFT